MKNSFLASSPEDLSAALGVPAGLANETTFLKDKLFPAFRTARAVQGAEIRFHSLTIQIPVFQDPGNRIRDGEQKAFFLKNRMLAPDPLELGNHLPNVYSGTQGKGNQSAYGLGLGRDGASGAADGGKD